MISKSPDSAVVILAAGLSGRMGMPKHLLQFSEGLTFLEHIVDVYQKFHVSEIIIVVNPSANVSPDIFRNPDSIRIVINKDPDEGRYSSIQLGINVLDTNVFIQNVDNPFVNIGLLMSLTKGLKDFDYAVPVYEGRGGHPILLSANILDRLRLSESSSRFNDVLKSFNRKNVEMNDPYIHANINTSSDYKKYFGET